MKRSPVWTTVAVTCALQAITAAQAQDRVCKGCDDSQWNKSNLTLARQPAPTPGAKVVSGYHVPSLAKRTVYNDIRMTALRNFKWRFPAVSNEMWQKVDGGFLATFVLNEVPHKAIYDKRGNWRSTVVSLDERILPPGIKHQIRSQYYDYVIKYVQEITLGDKVIYNAQIKCGRHWKIIRVCEEQILLQNEFSETLPAFITVLKKRIP